jgi:hypothetical protein
LETVPPVFARDAGEVDLSATDYEGSPIQKEIPFADDETRTRHHRGGFEAAETGRRDYGLKGHRTTPWEKRTLSCSNV